MVKDFLSFSLNFSSFERSFLCGRKFSTFYKIGDKIIKKNSGTLL